MNWWVGEGIEGRNLCRIRFELEVQAAQRDLEQLVSRVDRTDFWVQKVVAGRMVVALPTETDLLADLRPLLMVLLQMVIFQMRTPGLRVDRRPRWVDWLDG